MIGSFCALHYGYAVVRYFPIDKTLKDLNITFYRVCMLCMKSILTYIRQSQRMQRSIDARESLYQLSGYSVLKLNTF